MKTLYLNDEEAEEVRWSLVSEVVRLEDELNEPYYDILAKESLINTIAVLKDIIKKFGG